MLINHNCKTSCGLIRDCLSTNWKFGFVFDPWLYDLQLLVLKLCILVRYRELILVVPLEGEVLPAEGLVIMFLNSWRIYGKFSVLMSKLYYSTKEGMC